MSDSSSPVFKFPGEDAEMQRASDRARKTFRYFWREMSWERRRIIPACEIAAVKATFRDPPEVRSANPGELEAEHMWMMDVDFDGRKVYGTLINSPQSLQSVKEGDRVEVVGKQLADWMYVVSDEVLGGFTVDVMRSQMSKRERKQHDSAWGLDFGEVGVVNVVPSDWLGDQPKKKGLFGKPKVAQQDFNEIAKHEHPMSANMRTSLEESLAENPEMLSETDDHGFTLLHQLSLAGSLDGVDVCLRKGADPRQAAHNGLLPFDLARSLGWKRVMSRLQEALGE